MINLSLNKTENNFYCEKNLADDSSVTVDYPTDSDQHQVSFHNYAKNQSDFIKIDESSTPPGMSPSQVTIINQRTPFTKRVVQNDFALKQSLNKSHQTGMLLPGIYNAQIE